MSRQNDEYKGTETKYQRKHKIKGGEHRNGRLSQFKNHQPKGEIYPTEYLSKKDDE